MRRPSSPGFTLIEMMVVIGMVGIVLGIAAFTVQRGRQRLSVERAVAELKGRLERARSLAAVAGSRTGAPGPLCTNDDCRLQAGTNCSSDLGALGAQLWIVVRANGVVEVPADIQYDEGNDRLTFNCELFDLTDESGGGASAFAAPAADTTFAFTASGRLTVPGGGPNPTLQFVTTGLSDARTTGFRVLASGVTCAASVLNGPLCDEDSGA